MFPSGNNFAKKSAYFPVQQIPDSKKTKEWYKECIDSAISLAFLYEGAAKEKMGTYANLDNDILNEKEIEEVFNPMGLEDVSFPASMKNYPLSVPKIDLLQGEELKRNYDWVLRSRNETAYSTMQSDLNDVLNEILIEELTNKNYDEDKLEQRLSRFAKYAKYEYKDKHELTATRILQYLWREQDLKDKFNRGMRTALVMGQEVYRVDDYGNEPTVTKIDPRRVFSIRRGDSERIEDSDIIVEISYDSLGSVIDEFYEDLKDAEVEKLENARSNMTGNGGVLNYQHTYPPIYTNLDFGGDAQGFRPLSELQDTYNLFGLPFDANGNVRVARVRWVGRRKVGKLSYFDENGDEQTRIVSDKYKVNQFDGETVRWLWINEAYEATLIADDVYVRMRPREVQMRHFDNISKCFLGYVGTDYGKSLMSRMEPYQYLYNVYMRRLELALAKYKGAIYELDLSKVPDSWDLNKWMYYAEVLGWAPTDPFNEGKKGAATGKLAMQYNQGGKVMDAKIGDFIQQMVGMLNYIELQMGKIAGVPEQRLGQIQSSETVGGVERSLSQSSHITEKWFFVHDETKRRVLHALLDTAKHIWRKIGSKRLNYVMDDMSRQFLEFETEEFATQEFDLFVSNSREDYEIKQALAGLAQAGIQNGMSLSTIANVLRMDSVTEIARALESAEDDIAQRQMDASKQQQEAQQMLLQTELAEKDKDRELEYYKINKESETKLEEARMKMGESEEGEAEENPAKFDLEQRKLALNTEKIRGDLTLKERQLQEQIRSNKVNENIKRSKPTTSKK